MQTPTLIVFGGLPGTGKTTLARRYLAEWPAAYLRIDVIEQALVGAKVLAGDVGPAGYVVAYDIARSNLALGMSVLADCVNPLPVTRGAWRAVAAQAAARIVEVEIVCSDVTEHRRRVEERQADIVGHVLPTWDAVLRRDYAPWSSDRLVIDTARVGVDEAAAAVRARVVSGAI